MGYGYRWSYPESQRCWRILDSCCSDMPHECDDYDFMAAVAHWGSRMPSALLEAITKDSQEEASPLRDVLTVLLLFEWFPTSHLEIFGVADNITTF